MMYHDHHFHPLGYAYLANGLELIAAGDISDLLGMVAERGERVEGAILGQRLNDEGLAELRLPTAEDIDGVVSEKPVLLYRYCGHIAVANSAALAMAGIDARTPDPPGGSFDRDRSGRPTGVLRETAIRPVADALAPITHTPADSEILEALSRLPGLGIGSITGMVSYSGNIWGGAEDELEALIRLAPDLPIDIDVLVIADHPGDLVEARDRLERAEGRVRFHGWKDFSDGSLGGHTAAMYEPFADRDTIGTDRLDRSKAMEMAHASLSLGGVAAIHAIGDRANDLVLDVMEDLIREGADPERLRIEHASVLTERAVERFGALEVTASVQPAFLASEETWLERRLGPERMARAYPFRSLAEAGVRLIGGSDCPVEHPDPKVGINAAVDRHGIAPEQALTRRAAEAMFAPPPR